jgi:hypothetical protein
MLQKSDIQIQRNDDSQTAVKYYLTDDNCYERYIQKLQQIVAMPQIKRVCEVGGGANPMFSLEFAQEHGLDYTVLDISAEELEKAPSGYAKVLGDISSVDFQSDEKYDLVFSKFLAEHVRSGCHFHVNLYSILNDGGYSFHYFPTLYSLPFMANKLLPEWISEKVLLKVQPHRIKEGLYGKFPAYYSWCYGPTKSSIKRFEEIGFEVEEYVGFFGHGFYRNKKPLFLLEYFEELKSRFLVNHPVPLLTQFAHVLLKKT